MATKKVVTVTLNPALDLTGHLPTLELGTVNLVDNGNLHAAGKGINVAKVLTELGAEVTVTGLIGSHNKELFSQLFSELAINDQYIRVEGATRINVKLVEQCGRTSDMNFPGIEVSAKETAELEKTLFRLAKDHDYFVIAGSLPKGLDPALCASWIQQLNDMGKKVYFDSSRMALKAGIESSPWLIKPNEEELSELIGQKLQTPSECQKAAEKLENKGISNIVVSMGAEGVMWLNNGKWLQTKPPKMQVVSTVGAGDTLVAGFCWGHMQEMSKPELITFATALSALAVTQIGVGVRNTKQVSELQEKVTFHEIN